MASPQQSKTFDIKLFSQNRCTMRPNLPILNKLARKDASNGGLVVMPRVNQTIPTILSLNLLISLSFPCLINFVALFSRRSKSRCRKKILLLLCHFLLEKCCTIVQPLVRQQPNYIHS